jgi:hypothetical protein
VGSAAALKGWVEVAVAPMPPGPLRRIGHKVGHKRHVTADQGQKVRVNTLVGTCGGCQANFESLSDQMNSKVKHSCFMQASWHELCYVAALTKRKDSGAHIGVIVKV